MHPKSDTPKRDTANDVLVILPPDVDPGRLSDDSRALLELLDQLTGPTLEFTDIQFQLWEHSDGSGPLLISARREPVTQHNPEEPPTAVWQLTGTVVRWDFEQENWEWRRPLFRFTSFDTLSTWLQGRVDIQHEGSI